MSAKLQKIARQYRIKLPNMEPDGESVTVRNDVRQIPSGESRESEYARLKNELDAARKRFNEFMQRDKARRRK